MRWRRLCVDVDYGGNVLGASAELYDEDHEESQRILVASGGEVCHMTPPQALAYLYENYNHLQYELPFKAFT